MEVFTGLKPSPLLVRLMPLRMFKDVKVLDEARTPELINITTVHEVLDQMHKDVSETNAIRHTRAQKIHNARTNVLPLNINVGDNVRIRSMRERSTSYKKSGAVSGG